MQASKSILQLLKPGVYLSASAECPKRITLQQETPCTVIEQTSENFFVVMIDINKVLLAHKDSLETPSIN